MARSSTAPKYGSRAGRFRVGFLDAEVIIDALEYIEPKDFYRRNHQLIFQTMLTLNDRNEAIDVITIKDRLEQENY